MNVIKSVALATCLSFGLMLAGPVAAEKSEKAKSKETVAQEEEEDRGPDVSFMDSTEAQWFRRSVNDSVYWPGYSPNAVFIERDQVRTQKLNIYKPTTEVRFGKLQSRQAPPPDYKLTVNGKVVQVKD